MIIEPDDLLNHRALGADLMKMENEKQRLALFDELLSVVVELDWCLTSAPPVDLINHIARVHRMAIPVLAKARELRQ